MAAATSPGAAAGNTPQPTLPPGPQGAKLQTLLQRAHTLQAQGFTEQTSTELFQIRSFLKIMSQPPAPSTAGTPNQSDRLPLTNGTAISEPPSTVMISPNQMAVLRAQIQALQYIARNQVVPPHIQQIIYVPDNAELDTETGVPTNEALETPKAAAEETVIEKTSSKPHFTVPDGPLLERDISSAIYPYNAIAKPELILADAIQEGRAHKVAIPSLMPIGLDPYQIVAERQRFIDARIEHRVGELSSLFSTMSDTLLKPALRTEEDLQQLSSSKLRALIELKALRLRDKQRALRSSLVNRLQESSTLTLDRKIFRRIRKPALKDARQIESLERKQRDDRERRAKQKHLDYLAGICTHGQQVVAAGREIVARSQRLGKAVQKFHLDTEREEQKRVERISRERLRALKADDEEAYMKLIDTAKDTRITHLLRQTDTYLDGLAKAVRAQQNDNVHLTKHMQIGGTDESTFGAAAVIDEDDNGGEGRKDKVDYYGVAHRISEKIPKQPSLLIGGVLKDYQMKGLQWMVSLYNNRLNGILADEMGLGKTIQTISLVCFLLETKKEPGPFLVVVPLSTLTNWTLEFQKWAPGVHTLVYSGSPALRRQLQPQIRVGGFQVCLTTFEYIIREKAVLSKMKWVHMIIDEGHRMKNTQSKLSQTLTQFYSTRYRLILTGTPLQNNLPELWALLNFVLPKIFNSVKSFEEWFNTPFANTGTQDKLELNEEETLLVIRRLHKVLRPFLLRRLKKDVESELPDKVEKVVKCKMSALQSQLYGQMKKHGMLFDEEVKGKQTGIKGLNNTIMQFRKICQHPFVFPQIEDRMNPSHNLNSSIIRSSGKVALLDQLLPKLFATGHRVLMFFQMTNIMDIMADYFNYRGYKHFRLDGSTKPEERSNLLVQFNDPNTDVNLFMLSTRAGGLGLNLQTADTVIIYDSDWNPHADLQAQDRAHRIGQKKDVRILRFVTERSIEELMLARAKSKLDMDGKVIQAGRFDNKSTAEEQEEYLRSLLDNEQVDDTIEETASMDDEEINAIVARTEEEEIIFKRMDEERAFREESEWRAAGNTGPVPGRLMTFDELPEVYQRDEPAKVDSDIEIFTGRGARARNNVKYTDGLTDDQWAEALEDGAAEEAVEKRSRSRAKPANRIESSPEFDEPVEDDEWGNLGASAKKKGRKSRIRSPPGRKRKRDGAPAKALSPSPSLDDEEEIPESKRRKTLPQPKGDPVPPHVRERMKKAFTECYKAVQANQAEGGRQRCELFKELPSRKEYPDYYTQILQPIAMSLIRKRSSSSYYKTVTAYAEDWRLMFANARQYNQEGSWVVTDANELEKVFETVFARETVGSDLPGINGVLYTHQQQDQQPQPQQFAQQPQQQWQQQSYAPQQQQQLYQQQATPASSRKSKKKKDEWSDDEYTSE